MKFIPEKAGYTLEQIAAELNEALELYHGDPTIIIDGDPVRAGDIPFEFAQMFTDGMYDVINTIYRNEDAALDAEQEFMSDALTVFALFGNVLTVSSPNDRDLTITVRLEKTFTIPAPEILPAAHDDVGWCGLINAHICLRREYDAGWELLHTMVNADDDLLYEIVEV